MKALLIIALAIIALFVGKIFVDNGGNSILKTDQPATAVKGKADVLGVEIYPTRLQSTDNTVYASGTVMPNEEVELKSEASGRLVQLKIAEGSHLKKGDLIAKLDDSELRAQLKKLQFEEDLARKIEARQRKLLDINAISKEEYDLAVNKVNTLDADQELLQVQLEKTTVRAPFSGRIGFKYISEGAYITPNVVIANLVQINPVKIDFTIPEKYAHQVKVGQVISCTVDGLADHFEARIIAVDPKVDEDLRTLKLRALTKNPKELLLPGRFVRVSIPLERQESIMIPTESIIPVLKGKKVFVMKNGLAREAVIKTGIRTDTQVQVLEGLEVGDSVIVSGLMFLKEGMPVQLLKVAG